MENQDDIMIPEERKKKLEKMEKRKAKKDIEGEKRSVLTFKGKKSQKKDD